MNYKRAKGWGEGGRVGAGRKKGRKGDQAGSSLREKVGGGPKGHGLVQVYLRPV